MKKIVFKKDDKIKLLLIIALSAVILSFLPNWLYGLPQVAIIVKTTLPYATVLCYILTIAEKPFETINLIKAFAVAAVVLPIICEILKFVLGFSVATSVILTSLIPILYSIAIIFASALISHNVPDIFQKKTLITFTVLAAFHFLISVSALIFKTAPSLNGNFHSYLSLFALGNPLLNYLAEAFLQASMVYTAIKILSCNAKSHRPKEIDAVEIEI